MCTPVLYGKLGFIYFLSVIKKLNHAYFNNPGGPEIEVFLELGLELLLVLGNNNMER